MTPEEKTDLAFLLAQECPLLDDDMKWTAVELMYKGHLSRARLSDMLGVSLIDLEKELENYEHQGGYN